MTLEDFAGNGSWPCPHGLTRDEIISIAGEVHYMHRDGLFEWILRGAHPDLAVELAEQTRPRKPRGDTTTVPTAMLARNLRVQEHHLQPAINRDLLRRQQWEATRNEMESIDTSTRVAFYSRLAADLLTELGTQTGLWMMFFDLWYESGETAEDALATVRATL